MRFIDISLVSLVAQIKYQTNLLNISTMGIMSKMIETMPAKKLVAFNEKVHKELEGLQEVKILTGKQIKQLDRLVEILADIDYEKDKRQGEAEQYSTV